MVHFTRSRPRLHLLHRSTHKVTLGRLEPQPALARPSYPLMGFFLSQEKRESQAGLGVECKGGGGMVTGGLKCRGWLGSDHGAPPVNGLSMLI